MRKVAEKTARIVAASLSESVWIVRPSLARVLGGPAEAVLVEYVMALQSASGDGGALLIPARVWEATGLIPDAQQAARSSLRVLGILEETDTDAGTVGTVDRVKLGALAVVGVDDPTTPLWSSPAPLPVNPLPEKKKRTPPIGSPPDKKEIGVSRPVRCPDDFRPADRTVEIVLGYPSITAEDVAIETVKFVNHHQAKGNRFVDWQAAFRKWMVNVSTWRQDRDPEVTEGTTILRKGPMSAERRRDLEQRAQRGDSAAKRELGR